MTNHYQTLGVEKDADPATIKKAYRKKARQHHPDMNGGNPKAEEAFKQVNHAYRILSNPLLKERYDEFGDAGSEHSLEAESVKGVVNLLMQAVEDCDIQHDDIVSKARQVVKFNTEKFRANLKNLRSQVARWKEAKSRLKSKGSSDYIAVAFDTQIANLEGAIKAQGFQIELSEEMLKLLDDYEYRTDESRGAGVSMRFIGGTNIGWDFTTK